MAEPVQGLWIGRPLSVIERLSITSFLRQGHEYHLYCYDYVRNVPNGTVIKDAAEILPASEIFSHRQGPGAGSVAPFSDLFRFKLLLDRGGWWVDTDVVCLRPFDFSEPVIFASEHAGEKAKLATAVLRLPADHAIAARCYEAAHLADRSRLEWGQIGPDLLTRIVVEGGLRYPIMKPEVFCPIPWWHWDRILADDAGPAFSLLSEQTHGIHLWHEVWRREKVDLTRRFPEGSLFSRLLERYELEN
jgi:hypothetical protein